MRCAEGRIRVTKSALKLSQPFSDCCTGCELQPTRSSDTTPRITPRSLRVEYTVYIPLKGLLVKMTNAAAADVRIVLCARLVIHRVAKHRIARLAGGGAGTLAT